MNSTTDDNVTMNSSGSVNMMYPHPPPPQENRLVVIIWKVWPPCILLLGGFGNIATIVVMRRIKGGSSSQHLTLKSLAVADLALLYTGVLREWIYILTDIDIRDLHTAVCKLHTWLVYSMGTISAWLLTCVTMQRTLAVLRPHKMRMVCTVQRTWAVIGAVVFAACCLHFHFVIGMEVTDAKTCEEGSADYLHFVGSVFTWVDMLVSSLLPSSFLVICDAILSSTLYKAASSSSIAVHANSNTTDNGNSRKKTASKTTIMILALSCTFLILTLPVCLYFIWIRYVIAHMVLTNEIYNAAHTAFAVTMNMWYTNSAINFLLYCFTGTKFRGEFLKWLRCSAQHQLKTGSETSATTLSKTSRQCDTSALSAIA